MVVKRIGYGSIIFLAYSLLISTWIGTRTAPEIFADLLLTLTRYGGSLSQQSLWIQFLVLFLCFLFCTVLFIWQAQSREYRRWVQYFILLAAVVGLAQTVSLFSQGVRLSGPIICALGFAGMVVAAFKETFVQLPGREAARDQMENDWESKLVEAREKNVQASILSGWSDTALSAEIIQKLVNELRSNDAVVAVKDGMYVLLWNTPVNNAVTASQKALAFLEQNGYAGLSFGIAGFPEDGEHVRNLLDKADFTLQVCRQKSGCAAVTYREIVFPDNISTLFPVITAQTTEFMVRLNNLWEETQETGQPFSAIRFDISGSKVDEAAFIQQLSQWLRGRDQVGVLTKGSVIAVLVNTGADGCKQLLNKLEDQWLKKKNECSRITVSPILQINLEDNFKAFIEELMNIREN